MKRLHMYFLLASILLLLAGCGPEEVTAVALPTRTPRPTFTPTPVVAAPQPVAPVNTPAPVAEAPVVADTATPASAPAQEQPPTDTPVPAPQTAKAVNTSAQANVRTGPGTNYALAGALDRGAELEIVGKNPAGDWWQLCCVNGQKVWIAAFLVDTSGPVDTVAVAADIPAPPPVAAPAPAAPAAPTPIPAPAEPVAPPAPVYAIAKAGAIEGQENSNPYITFYGWICPKQMPCSDSVSGYKMVGEGPLGRGEVVFQSQTQIGNPGLEGLEFWYSGKLEFAGTAPGEYRVWVADMSGNQVSEAWTLVVSGTTRTFFPRWIAP